VAYEHLQAIADRCAVDWWLGCFDWYAEEGCWDTGQLCTCDSCDYG